MHLNVFSALSKKQCFLEFFCFNVMHFYCVKSSSIIAKQNYRNSQKYKLSLEQITADHIFYNLHNYN